MTISPILPGLLSRTGPSLFSPAMVFDPQPVCYFSTHTLLDAFQPDPESGRLFAPALSVDGTSFFVGPVGEESAPALRRTLEGIFADAARISDRGLRAGVLQGSFLPATGAAWRLEEYVGCPVSREADILKNGNGTVVVSDRSGKFRRFALHSEGGFDLAVGWNGPEIRVSQEIRVGATGVFERETYLFEFLGATVGSLKTMLGVEGVSGGDVALELAARIYASGQYTAEEMGCSLQVMGSKSKWRTLRLLDGRWNLPEGRENGPADPLVIGTRRTIPRLDRSSVRLSLAETYWEPKTEHSGHLLVRLHSVPSKGLLPLDPLLKEVLWDGALHMFFNRWVDSTESSH